MENGTAVDWSERFIALVLTARPTMTRAEIGGPISRWLTTPASLATATDFCLASIKRFEALVRPGSRMARDYGYSGADLELAKSMLAGERALLAALYEYAAQSLVDKAPVLGLVNLLDEIDPCCAWAEIESDAGLRKHAVDLVVTGLVDEVFPVSTVERLVNVGGAL